MDIIKGLKNYMLHVVGNIYVILILNFFQVLENMHEITYCSTWSEAQVLLLENSAFKNDVSLLGMDKEDALIGKINAK